MSTGSKPRANYPTSIVTNAVAGNQTVSELAAEADHGTGYFISGVTAGATGNTSSPTVTLSTNCPATVQNTVLKDTTTGQNIGWVLSCSTGGAVATLYANAAAVVTNGDSLVFANYIYGVMVWGSNYLDGTGSGAGGANVTPHYWEADPNVASGGWQAGGGGGCATPITLGSNTELRTGGAATYPNVNLFTLHAGGC